MTSGYALAVRFTLKDSEAAQRFDDLVAQTVHGIREEPGTLIYTVHEPVDAPLVRVFYELYADRTAFLRHEEQAHTKRFLQAREEFLADTTVTFLNERAELSKRPGAGAS
ncbi:MULTISPECIES: putative quinol monooxygenase [Streptomyces]|uniref:Antibiotic biosynthesis monooxygenase n=1 Tax=Streptomyces evansiae TaxID=3075535 RepID=A0ABU2RAE8_9ACTN|nr:MULTISPECIES: antibiotic biosynthesis monooxygenase [unclassified Streptomyces]MDT0412730.1 antibiotic biosynthesis monooxygenase [Streptomyces sp. DSM 41979]MYQ56424.1 antibiotic biosynthesis monooxygenase [Streptomyces sp. SID4926]SCE48174.1 Quinol monooxygenase YgiN [Streptomyces sp. DfronAA-171]